MMQNDSDSDDTEENVFYFESDHLALRGNAEYSKMLRAICILEAQRNKTIKDIEELVINKKKYLSDTQLFLQKISNNEEIISPMYMTIAKLPEIRSYELKMPEELLEVKSKTDCDSVDQRVRGRIFDQTKPETFNQLWTCEEQRRLEELLLEHPPEPIEIRRFTKIANALGNRTPQQVASRVQKFFKKLYTAGMPIPGRLPKSRKNGNIKKFPYRSLIRPSTFFPHHNVPVHIPEEDDLHQFDMKHCNSNLINTKSYSDYSNIENSDNKSQIIHMLEVIRDEKRYGADKNIHDSHVKKCEICQSAAITGIRWHCNSCYTYIHQCSDCIVNQLLTNKFEHLYHEIIKVNESY